MELTHTNFLTFNMNILGDIFKEVFFLRIEQFEYLLEISKNKSMNAASKNLHITPQALSTSIKKLEEELDLTILERTTMGVSLTKDGQSLLYLVENFLSGIRELQGKPYKKIAPISGPMHLSFPQGFAETYLPGLLKTIYADYPDLEIISTPYCYTDIIGRVCQNLDEYGLTYKIYINDEDIMKDIPSSISFTTLYKAKFYCITSNSFPIAKYKSISLKTFLEYPIILHDPSAYLMTNIINFAGTPSRIIHVPSVESLKELVMDGLGISFTMYNFSDNNFALDYGESTRTINFKENITAEFGFIVKKDYSLSENALLQIEYLTKLFQK